MSCSWLNKHNFNLKSGNYWINRQGKASYEYCRIDDTGIPPGRDLYFKQFFSYVATSSYNFFCKDNFIRIIFGLSRSIGGGRLGLKSSFWYEKFLL